MTISPPDAVASSEQYCLQTCRPDLPVKVKAASEALADIASARQRFLDGDRNLLVGAIASLLDFMMDEEDIVSSLNKRLGIDHTAAIQDALYDELGHYWYQLPCGNFALIV